MLEYLVNDAKRINRFNDEIDQDIMPDKEVEIRYKDVNTYQFLIDVGEAKRRPGLSNAAFNAQQKTIVHKREELREQEVKDSYMKNAKELSILKSIERSNQRTPHFDHISHKSFNTSFAGLAQLFEGLFGS